MNLNHRLTLGHVIAQPSMIKDLAHPEIINLE